MMVCDIALRAEWYAPAKLPVYVPDGYQKDGFNHCFELQQLERVAGYNFRGRSDLTLLEIIPTRLQPEHATSTAVRRSTSHLRAYQQGCDQPVGSRDKQSGRPVRRRVRRDIA